ncbi:MAG: energy transducer TonB [Chitinispirillaceae bacterium]|nr:energy transducer TonB [Chitinispirillaceae bacterium]
MTTCTPSAPVAENVPEKIDNTTGDSTFTTIVPPDNVSTTTPSLTAHKRLSFPPQSQQRGILGNDRLFPLLLLITATISIFAGLYAKRIPPLQGVITRTTTTIKTEFHLVKPKQKPVPAPVVKKKIPVKNEQPVDLTRKPLLKQKEENIEEKPPEPSVKPTRKVYGLRKVYSTGLGSGGSMTNAVVGKIGNTIEKEYDTITAMESDIRGTIVSTTTITTPPKFRKVVKPHYTKEMVEQKVEGTIKVKVLVDIDGKVKKATCLNDIGFNSAAQAVKATMAMEFVPAMRGDDPVAVWIIVPIRFVLLG